MFDLGWTELLLIGVVALIVVGPKDLPNMFRTVGQFVGKAKGMAREFSKAMNDAADESGVRDLTESIRKATNPVGSALSEMRKSTDSFTKKTLESGLPKDKPTDTAAKPADPKPAIPVATETKTPEVATPAVKTSDTSTVAKTAAATGKPATAKKATATKKAPVAKKASTGPKATAARKMSATKTPATRAKADKAAAKVTSAKSAATKTAAAKPARKRAAKPSAEDKA